MLRVLLVAVAYLAMNIAILMAVGLVFDRKAASVCDQVVREHAARICDMLGIVMPPITVVDGFNHEELRLGAQCEHTIRYGLGVRKSIQVRRIVLYARAIVRSTISEATLFAPAVAFTFRQRLYDMVVRCLAHELRHVWQLNTGWMAENSANLLYQDNAFAIDLSLVPYAQRVEERDANEFATRYMKEAQVMRLTDLEDRAKALGAKIDLFMEEHDGTYSDEERGILDGMCAELYSVEMAIDQHKAWD